jgi:hypothetical protein
MISGRKRHVMVLCWLARSTIGILLLLAEVPAAMGQAGPPCGPDLPIKCTPGKDAAIVLGFVGAGVLAVYLGYRIDHPRHESSIIGCSAVSEGMKTLVEDKTQTVYLLAGSDKKVKPGERLLLRGQKKLDPSGRDVFKVRKLVRDAGSCETQSTNAPVSSPASE